MKTVVGRGLFRYSPGSKRECRTCQWWGACVAERERAGNPLRDTGEPPRDVIASCHYGPPSAVILDGKVAAAFAPMPAQGWCACWDEILSAPGDRPRHQ